MQYKNGKQEFDLNLMRHGEVNDMEKDNLKEVLAELKWVMENSDGVMGLDLMHKVMPWDKVKNLYMPTTKELTSHKIYDLRR